MGSGKPQNVEKIWESKNSGVMVEDLMKEFLMHVDLEY
jgi:hypothetical protein